METLIKKLMVYTITITHIVTYSTQGFGAVTPIESSAQPKKIIIQSIDAKEDEFEEFLKENPQYKSLESQRPEVPARSLAQLYSLKQLAEAEFMGDDPNKALKLYQSIIELALKQDWKKQERQVIYTAFFRIAQLKPDEAQKWISKAIAFDFNATPNPELIPSSLLATLKTLKETKSKELIALNLDVKATYYINGIKNLDSVDPESLYRVSYVSNVYGIKTEVAKGNLVPDIFPFSTPLVQGHCQKQTSVQPLSYSQVQANLKQSFVFSSAKCAPKVLSAVSVLKSASAANEANLAQQLPSKTVKTETVNLNLYPSSIDTTTLAKVETSPLNFDNKEKMNPTKKKWIIILSSVAALTLGAFLIHKHNKSGDARSPQPAQTEDF